MALSVTAKHLSALFLMFFVLSNVSAADIRDTVEYSGLPSDYDGGTDFQTVIDTGGVGLYSSLGSSGNRIFISYYDSVNKNLKLAYQAGLSVVTMVIDEIGDVGMYSSLGFDAVGMPIVAYYDATNGDLKYMQVVDNVPVVSVIDSYGDVGSYASLDSRSGDIGIAYYDATAGALKYASWNGGGFDIETVDDAGDVGQYASLRLDNQEKPHIAYYDATNGDLKLARKSFSSWTKTVVDPTGDSGKWASLALDNYGYERISYFNAIDYDLMHAAFNGTGWAITAAQQVGFIGQDTDIEVKFNDSYIVYFDAENIALKLAKLSGYTWKTYTLYDQCPTGFFPSLGFRTANSLAVSFYDMNSGSLMFISE